MGATMDRRPIRGGPRTYPDDESLVEAMNRHVAEGIDANAAAMVGRDPQAVACTTGRR